MAFCCLAVEQQLKIQIPRIFQVYGEGELESRLWPSMRKAAMNGEDFPMTKGEQVRDFIEVTSVAEKLVNALSFNGVQSGIPHLYNLASGKPQTLLDFCEYWWKQWEAEGKLLVGALPYRDNEVMRFVPLIY